jgi:ABC-type transport system involved in cytochrome c biogenesis permease subunit
VRPHSSFLAAAGVLVVLIGEAIGAGFAARAARQRVWLVVLAGVTITGAAVFVGGALLTPAFASS